MNTPAVDYAAAHMAAMDALTYQSGALTKEELKALARAYLELEAKAKDTRSQSRRVVLEEADTAAGEDTVGFVENGVAHVLCPWSGRVCQTSATCKNGCAYDGSPTRPLARSSTQESYSAALTAKAGEDFETWWKRYRTNVVRRTEREIARDAWLAFAASAIERMTDGQIDAIRATVPQDHTPTSSIDWNAHEHAKVMIPVDVLRKHWLHAVQCDHERKMDMPICACSEVNLGWHASVGLAVEAWLTHLAGVVDEARCVSSTDRTGDSSRISPRQESPSGDGESS